MGHAAVCQIKYLEAESFHLWVNPFKGSAKLCVLHWDSYQGYPDTKGINLWDYIMEGKKTRNKIWYVFSYY